MATNPKTLLTLRGGRNQFWSPHNLGRDVLVAWWSATGLTPGAVVTWTDMMQSLAPTQATGSKQPIASATSFNAAYPGVTFDGVDDTLQATGGAAAKLPNGTNAGAIFVLCDQTAVGGSGAAMDAYSRGASSANAVRQVERVSSIGVNRARVRDQTTGLQDTAVDFSGKHVICGIWDSVVEYGFIDDVAFNPASTADSFNTSTTTLQIGSRLGIDSYWTGVISDIIELKGSITTAMRQKVSAFLLWNTGLQALLPVGHPYRLARP